MASRIHRDPPPDRRPGKAAPGQSPFVLVGTIVGAKVATLAVVLAMEWSTGAGALVAATTGHWLVVGGALVATPLAFAVRLRRVRARRADLLRAEFFPGDAKAESAGSVEPGPRRALPARLARGVDTPRPPS